MLHSRHDCTTHQPQWRGAVMGGDWVPKGETRPLSQQQKGGKAQFCYQFSPLNTIPPSSFEIFLSYPWTRDKQHLKRTR